MAKRRKKRIKPVQFKKLGGSICQRLPDKTFLEELREGDYIVYWDNGYRVAKVKKNHKGYKYRWVKTYPSVWQGHVLNRSRKIKPEKIKSGWRKIEDGQKEEDS